jgi:serine/threonine protein kinase
MGVITYFLLAGKKKPHSWISLIHALSLIFLCFSVKATHLSTVKRSNKRRKPFVRATINLSRVRLFISLSETCMTLSPLDAAEYWAHVSDTGRDFVKTCLTLDPTKRPTAAQALQHKVMGLLLAFFLFGVLPIYSPSLFASGSRMRNRTSYPIRKGHLRTCCRTYKSTSTRVRHVRDNPFGCVDI